jgi:hypothetical protein
MLTGAASSKTLASARAEQSGRNPAKLTALNSRHLRRAAISRPAPGTGFLPAETAAPKVPRRRSLRAETEKPRPSQGVVSIDNKLSSWVTVQAQALKQMMSLARMLKLTPLARRSNPSRPGKPQQLSYYDQMRLEQECET